MSDPRGTQAIGRLRAEIRRYLCKEIPAGALQAVMTELGLAITLTPPQYVFRVACPPVLTPAQEESCAGLPKLYAVDPPQREPAALVITGSDVECLPGILTELSSVGLVFASP